ncbi:tetrahydroberberine oxidase-like [Populus alba]|uniref:tetrahydroberberine oxidase-like n=1 Tax=Populus alba TaxID=43335 RepID=UPI001588CD1B|nr:berberine bridge enzyme-like 22 [Populus alba]
MVTLEVEGKMNHIVLVSLLLSVSWATCSSKIHENFTQCMSTEFNSYLKSFQTIFTPQSPMYSCILQSSKQNLRWLNSTSKPHLIITPFHESEIRAVILCSKKRGLQFRVRSGGHDYEGLSFLCKTPFIIIIDLVNLRGIEIDIEDETAWVQTGATLGELYYAIAKKSTVHGFPAGLCPTVGVGGHFTGGGFGILLRKYGLAADNVIDAYLIGVNGRILDRQGMGEDLFWAIRGGGGASFGIILSWKIKLIRVPPTVIVFTVPETIEQGATKLVHRWQYIAGKLHEDLFIRIVIQNVGESTSNKKTVEASFNSLFLGGINRLITLMNDSFPELGLVPKNCTEMSWIESTVYFAGFQKGSPLEVLLDKTQLYKAKFKAKSDFVTVPIPEFGLEGIWERFLEEGLVFMIMDPFGGRMNEIPESHIPFPHREGNLYNIQYLVKWDEDEARATHKHVNWIKMLYRYMKPYVSKFPRAAYLNYRDLDLGINKHANTSYPEARDWGIKYFKGNFKRLIQVKSKVDSDNFFRSEQSIPSIHT